MKKRRYSMEKRKTLTGLLFISPWLIGFPGLFLRSMVSSFLYSVSDTAITAAGMTLTYSGLGQYYRALFVDSRYVRFLTDEIGAMIPRVIVILAFSLLMAVIMSGRFHGRTFFRAIFFLPVICGSGLILSIMNGDVMSGSILSGSRSSMLFQTYGVDRMLLQMGMSSDVVGTMMGVINGMFDLAWQSGLQILLFMSGILSISPALYEAAKIEGATGWEAFWKITFPMLSSTMLLNAVYSIIDRFTDFENSVMKHILGFAKGLDFSYSSALAWIYFAVIALLIAIVYGLVNRHIVYTVE